MICEHCWQPLPCDCIRDEEGRWLALAASVNEVFETHRARVLHQAAERRKKEGQ